MIQEYIQDKISKNILTRGKEIPIHTLVFDPSLIHKCEENWCGNYGKNHMCPPMVGTMEMWKKAAEKYQKGILVQKEIFHCFEKYDDTAEKFIHEKSKTFQEDLYLMETELKEMGYSKARAFAGGSCKLCLKCAGFEGLPCRNPDKARPSMEATGIDVMKTCENNGYESDFIPKRVLLTALIYLE